MDRDDLLEILEGVFAIDTKAFATFIKVEVQLAINSKKDVKDARLLDIEEQLEHVLQSNKIEDVASTSSILVDLLNTLKDYFKE